MLTRTISAALAAVLLVSTPVWAQETAEQPADQAAAPAAPEAPADLNMGGVEADEPAEPQVGDPYIRETFGDWALRCIKTEEAQDPCQLYQLLLNAEGDAMAEISMFPLADGGQAKAGATVIVPLETLLTENLKISVDGANARVYPFSFCNHGGCVARIGFTEADIAKFKAGNVAKMTMVPAAAPDQTVELEISLTGFTAGITSTNPQQ